MKKIIFAALIAVVAIAGTACSTKEVVEEPAPEPVMVERG